MTPARAGDPVLDSLLQAAHALHPQTMDLSLERLHRLLARLGHPERRLPPVFHVAGTNGKGSTVAFLRACLEAQGYRVHVYTSPHLVRFNERIRVAGALITDEALADLIRAVLGINAGQSITFFELTTAVAFLAFAREPADACVLEVGLGGRLDATNVVDEPVVTGIAQLGLDHQQWLGESILEIAGEKAAIAKHGRPMVTARYPASVAARVAEVTALAGAKLLARGDAWDAALYQGQLHYRDVHGKLHLPLPRLAGAHQLDNAALAVAMLRHQDALPVREAAYRAGLGWAEWPARLQRLDTGSLPALLPPGAELWLDGGHNPAAGRALADALRLMRGERPLRLIVGMLETKDVAGFFRPFASLGASVTAVPVPGHAGHPPEQIAAAARAAGLAAETAADVGAALIAIARGDRRTPPLVLVAGSLYLAGSVLAANGMLPA